MRKRKSAVFFFFLHCTAKNKQTEFATFAMPQIILVELMNTFPAAKLTVIKMCARAGTSFSL